MPARSTFHVVREASCPVQSEHLSCFVTSTRILFMVLNFLKLCVCLITSLVDRKHVAR
jgi:hypothetical protein